MAIYLKKFETMSQYNAYTADTTNFIKPNVSLTVDNNTVYYNPYVPPETRVVAKYNVTSTSSPTQLCHYRAVSQFSMIEIDDVVQPSVVSAYTFSTTGEHTVKYTLTDPTSIGASAFGNCDGLTSIDIPDTVTSIGEGAFSECSSLTTCTIGSGVTSIGSGAFYYCNSLTSIVIPSGVTSIGSVAFYYCTSLTSIVIPSGVTSIGRMAFSNCTSLTSCTIGSGVTSIGNEAFRSCSGLTSVTVNATTPPTLGEDAFERNASGRKIYVPSASVETYKSATNWSTYASDIEPIS